MCSQTKRLKGLKTHLPLFHLPLKVQFDGVCFQHSSVKTPQDSQADLLDQLAVQTFAQEIDSLLGTYTAALFPVLWRVAI